MGKRAIDAAIARRRDIRIRLISFSLADRDGDFSPRNRVPFLVFHKAADWQARLELFRVNRGQALANFLIAPCLLGRDETVLAT